MLINQNYESLYVLIIAVFFFTLCMYAVHAIASRVPLNCTMPDVGRISH